MKWVLLIAALMLLGFAVEYCGPQAAAPKAASFLCPTAVPTADAVPRGKQFCPRG